MKRVVGICIMLLYFSALLLAQEGVEHENILKLKIGAGYQLDSYLSPLGYTGMLIGLGNEWRQPFRQDTHLGREGKLDNWAHVGRVDVNITDYISAAHFNPGANTGSYLGFKLSAGWGAFYEWKWIEDRLRVHAGPYLETDFMVRYHTVNVNKIVSFDVAIDVMAMAGISWSFYGQRTSYRLNYQLRTNLIGFDYLPEYWESYYEIYQGVPGQPRCSGHWNHNTLKHELTLDMQLPHSTWRIGAEHELVNYGTDNQHFMRNHICLVLGCIWKYKIHANARL